MKKEVVFLDPKGPAFDVIRVAKERGYWTKVILSDPSLLNLPDHYSSALKNIDAIEGVPNWNDEERIVGRLMLQNKIIPIAGVYSGMDPCASILARIREKLGLPTSKSDNINIVLDKFLLRECLYERGLSRIRNYHSRDVLNWRGFKCSGPAYFKPIHGFFSAFVKRCENMDDLNQAIEDWAREDQDAPAYVTNYLWKSNDFHLEDAFDGELLSVEAIAVNGELKVLGLLSRILYSKNQVIEMGSCFPYPHPLSEKIIELVTEVHKVLGLTDGPTHTEVIVNKNGEVEIIDLNPRFVGADVLQSINHAYGIKIEEALFSYAIGEEIKFEKTQNRYSCIQYFLPPEVDSFEGIEFPSKEEIKFKSVFIKKGRPLGKRRGQIDYLGCYLTVMPTFQSAIDRSMELRESVKINHHFLGEY